MVDVEEIRRLVEEFRENYALYASNESQTRQSLIDVMLESLGWDVRDPRVVRVEPPVETKTGKKKADYILYDDRGQPVVVIEAKAPKVKVAQDRRAIFQVLRYGWNLETVSVGVLTDFEEWEVYNTSTKPTKETGRFRITDLCCTCDEYEERWDTLTGYFSRRAVLEGRLRAYATTTKVSLAPDEAFLKDLERYRKLIADALVKNEGLHYGWDLSENTQRVLDRLLLLRILEDRGYGERGGWLHQIAEAADPGRHLSDLVSRLQPTYDSRFFESHPVDELRLEPEKVRAVVKELADPDSVYDFSAMPVEIIGKAYEKFLGSQMRITPKRWVKIEPKPEVRKAGGVYYTPRYIVDYIALNTLGPLFEGKSASQAAKIKILDPACGSGSFLIGAARWLERWYSDKYNRHLTHEERRTIVLRHLHGVDIDSNAVEVTQLSLCLWLLEKAPLQMEALHAALLPDLSGNVKCGNSLIGSDFYTSEGQQDLFADEETRHRVNAFDWDGPHGFPEIMKKTTRRLWFVTFVTHNSRVSERMVECGVAKKDPLIFGPDDQILVAEKIADVCKTNKIPTVTWNVLRDHVHMLIGAKSETELNEFVRKIKGGSARAYREAGGLGRGGHVWAQKFNRKAIKNEEELNNVYAYIKENHLKHAEKDARLDKGLKPLVSGEQQDQDKGLQQEDKGLQPLVDPTPDKGLQLLAEEGSKGLNRAKRAMPLAKPLVSGTGKGLKPLVSDELLRFRRKLEPILDSCAVSVEEASQTRGGFDAVIGNPPYIRIQAMKEWAPVEVECYKKLYRAASKGNYDIYAVFVERGLSLLNPKGRLGFILPHKFFNAKYGEPLRKLISDGRHLAHVVHFGDEQVFDKVSNYTCLLFLTGSPSAELDIVKVADLEAWHLEGVSERGTIPADAIKAGEWNFVIGPGAGLFERLSNMPVKLGDVATHIFQGLVTSCDPVYLLTGTGKLNSTHIEVISKQTGKTYWLERDPIWPLCKGSRDIRRYIATPSKLVLFPYNVELSKQSDCAILISEEDFRVEYPQCWEYLVENYKKLSNRESGKMRTEKWYGYVYPKSVSLFSVKKIINPSIAPHASYTLDEEGKLYFVGSGGGGGGGYGIILMDGWSYEYILGLLNSCLLDFFHYRTATTFRGGYFAYNRQYVEQLPIRAIDFDDKHDKARHDKVVSLVERMLELHKKLPEAKGSEKRQIEQLIERTDREIDALVYQLYDLTDDEIKIVEEAVQR
jgi:REP element-mobilizing transposase RayT